MAIDKRFNVPQPLREHLNKHQIEGLGRLNGSVYEDWITGGRIIYKAMANKDLAFALWTFWSLNFQTNGEPDFKTAWATVTAAVNRSSSWLEGAAEGPGNVYLAPDAYEKLHKLNHNRLADLVPAGHLYYNGIVDKTWAKFYWLKWAKRGYAKEWEDEEFDTMWDKIVVACKHPVVVNVQNHSSAPGLLGKAKEILEQRAKDYDKPEGERSMGTVAQMFNLATQRTDGRAISESEAWLVMALLKIVRDRSTPNGHQDSCEDLVSYSALYGEARLKEGLDRFALKKALNEQYGPLMSKGEREANASGIDNGIGPWMKFSGKPKPLVLSYRHLTEEAVKIDRVKTGLRVQMEALLNVFKMVYGAPEAKRIIRHCANCDRMADVPDNMIPEVITFIYQNYGANLK